MLRRHVVSVSAALSLAFSLVTVDAGFAPVMARDLSRGPASVAELAEGLADTVVNIAISQKAEGGVDDSPAPLVDEGAPFPEYFRDFFDDKGGRDTGRNISSLGSGFVIGPEGYIVTNNHVIEGATQITVNFANGSKLPATLVGTDKKTDLALLKVEPKAPLKFARFGDSDEMRIGDWVMAIGNPFGLGGTVTLGIVSARGRNINAGPYDDFLQTDAAINKGNSGGPLFNMYGEVIGVNTAIISPSGGSIGIGFATPSELAANVVSQLKEFGETRRGWLGVRIQPVEADVAESLGLDMPRGALIAGIIEGGPVSDGPLQAGDVVLTFNGKEILNAKALTRAVAESPVDKDLPVKIMRDGKEMDVTVRLALVEETAADEPSDEETVQPFDEDEMTSPDDESENGGEMSEQLLVLGMLLSPLDDAAREEFGIDEAVDGVLVSEVEEGSAAAQQGIVPGDVVVEVSQEFVATPDEVATRVGKLREEGRRNAQVLVSNAAGDLRFLALRLE
ncbi:Do family serine endopeptidase [Rhizobium sp. L1K21]|uniref:Do family serine endopeptidase n=1 Tax=Rhizobium sp. L1K21 TaxID=2954933 RepID=UPI00209386AB|nr:Do family serine endopeptidase [Rhizobium sp. L1K21]MCO6185706.1 Do family serine endopeptidase [Rhizobium sp. L1K21]